MDILAKRLVRIAEELTEEDEDFHEEHGMFLHEYEKAKSNPIFGCELYNGMTYTTAMWCSESREKVREIGQKLKKIITDYKAERIDDYTLDDKFEELVNEPDIVYVNEETNDLKEIDDEYFAYINGEYRLVDVISGYGKLSRLEF